MSDNQKSESIPLDRYDGKKTVTGLVKFGRPVDLNTLTDLAKAESEKNQVGFVVYNLKKLYMRSVRSSYICLRKPVAFVYFCFTSGTHRQWQEESRR